MSEYEYRFRLEGLSPLLMHWDNLEAADIIDAWLHDPENKQMCKPGDDRVPAWRWKHSTYNDGKHIAIPEDMIRSCLMGAGARVLTGRRQETYKRYTQSGLLFLEPYFEFSIHGKQIPWPAIEAIDGTYAEHRTAAQELGFMLWAKRARIGQSKHVRVRPRFDDWAVDGIVVVIEERLTQEVLTMILDQAGRYVGIGDWRPSAPRSPGPFGRFKADLQPL